MDFFNKYKKEIILVASTALVTFLLCLGLSPKETKTVPSTQATVKTTSSLSNTSESSPSLPALYVGSKNSDKYHKSDCQWAKKIKTYNKVIFNSSAIAKSKGYSPCGTCID